MLLHRDTDGRGDSDAVRAAVCVEVTVCVVVGDSEVAAEGEEEVEGQGLGLAEALPTSVLEGSSEAEEEGQVVREALGEPLEVIENGCEAVTPEEYVPPAMLGVGAAVAKEEELWLAVAGPVREFRAEKDAKVVADGEGLAALLGVGCKDCKADCVARSLWDALCEGEGVRETQEVGES